MQITFLGTACMMPTKERNTSGVFISYKSEGLLIDCGEGTQRQMKIAGIALPKTTKILMTHWHGDHSLGLPGLLQTLAAGEYEKTLEIYGPVGSKKALKAMLSGANLEAKMKINVIEVEDGVFFKGKDFSLAAYKMNHPVPCVSFAFMEHDRRKIDVSAVKKLGIPEGPLLGKLQKGNSIKFKGKTITPEKTTTVVKGRKVAFITDTRLNKNCYKTAQDADVLICESVYSSKLKEKADVYGHMTSLDAAQIASRSQVKKLVLTHFSARYKNTQEIEEDARVVFDNVVCAEDFMKVNV